MFRKSYCLNSQETYVLYGLNGISEDWIKKAQQNSFKIKAILDRNAANIVERYGIKAFQLEEYSLEDHESPVVIIFLQNVLQHESIYDELVRKGFKKIIYYPTKNRFSSVDEFIKIRNAYNNCIRFQIEEERVLWVPVELCFTCDSEYKSNWGRVIDEETKARKKKYVDGRNLLNLEAYQSLFDYIEGKKDNCDLYFKALYSSAIDEDAKKRILIDRKKVFDYLEQCWLDGLHNFESAPLAGSIYNGKIIIEDGCHRAVFLTHCKHFKWLPVRLSREEANIFFTESIKTKIESIYEVD